MDLNSILVFPVAQKDACGGAGDLGQNGVPPVIKRSFEFWMFIFCPDGRQSICTVFWHSIYILQIYGMYHPAERTPSCFFAPPWANPMKVLIVATMPKRLHPVYLCSSPHPPPSPPHHLLHYFGCLPVGSDHAFSTSSPFMIPHLHLCKVLC